MKVFFFFLKKPNKPTKIDTGENQTWDLERSTLQGPKPAPPGQPKWVGGNES